MSKIEISQHAVNLVRSARREFELSSLALAMARNVEQELELFQKEKVHDPDTQSHMCEAIDRLKRAAWQLEKAGF